MEVILKVDIEGLGKTGQKVNVKVGHARNYLFPKGFALEATQANLKIIQQQATAQSTKLQKEKEQAKALEEKLSITSCTIAVPAGPDDKLFGTVTPADIADLLQKEGIEIDKKKIQIDEPINKTGVYSITVKLHPEITGYVKLWVVKE